MRFVLTRENMKPCRLKQHFESCHRELVGKPIDYIRRKPEYLKNCRLDSERMWAEQDKSLLEALYRIVLVKQT